MLMHRSVCPPLLEIGVWMLVDPLAGVISSLTEGSVTEFGTLVL